MFSIACLASPRPPALLAPAPWPATRGNPRGSGAVDLGVCYFVQRKDKTLSVISRHCHHLVINYVKKSFTIQIYVALKFELLRSTAC